MGTNATHSISSLLNGVSQQPAITRLASQLEHQEDCFSSLVEGLTRRPPFEYLNKLAIGGDLVDYINASVHSVNRDNVERYTIVITNGEIEVFDTLTGASKTVNKPHGTGYLTTVNPQESIRLLTVEDYTFIVNREAIVRLTEEVAPPPFSVAGEVSKFSDLPANGPPFPGTAYPSTYRVKGTGDPNVSGGPYWVAWFGAAGAYTGGWAEVPSPGTRIALDPQTMPHALISNGNGTFTFRQLDWPKRVAGSFETLKAPSFVNRKISGVFFARRRLGFVTGSTIVMSRGGGDWFNFWREKGSQLLATDPIDVTEAGQDFHAATAYGDDLLMWTTKAQFRFASSDTTLTPNTVEFRQISRYDNSSNCEPFVIGDQVFFVNERGGFAQFHELLLAANGKAATAPAIADHVPRYIPAGVTTLVASNETRSLIARSSAAPRRLYVWTHFEEAQTRRQSSWSRWTLPEGGGILDVSMDKHHVIVVARYSDGIHVLRADLSPWVQTTDDAFYRINLDWRVRGAVCSPIYFPSTNRTQFTLPYAVASGIIPVLVPIETSPANGISDPIVLTSQGGNVWSAPGNWMTALCYIGLNYSSWFELSEQFPPRSDNAASLDKTFTDEGRLTLQSIQWTVEGTSAVAGDVWEKSDESAFGMNGRITIDGVGPPAALTVPSVPTTPLFKFSGKEAPTRRKTFKIRQPVHKRSTRAIIRIGSVDHRPFAVLGAKWTGTWQFFKQQI